MNRQRKIISYFAREFFERIPSEFFRVKVGSDKIAKSFASISGSQ